LSSTAVDYHSEQYVATYSVDYFRASACALAVSPVVLRLRTYDTSKAWYRIAVKTEGASEYCSIFVTGQVCVVAYQKVQSNCSRGKPFYQHAQQQFCAFKSQHSFTTADACAAALLRAV
jgi:hypothetical protein